MFPPGQSDDHFLFHYNPHQEPNNIKKDLIILQGQASLERNNNTNKRGKSQQHGDNNNEKKMMRKEIERQRRQHMAMLHSSLRSLLPLESIKGKRSISDHINEAENYIKYLKKKIQELSLKRDQLKTISDLEALGQGSSNSDNSLTNCVSIHPSAGGVEIVISSAHRKVNLQLSKVLEAILYEALVVICCVSTKTDEGFFHTIQAEAGDLTFVGLCALQQKLNHMIN